MNSAEMTERINELNETKRKIIHIIDLEIEELQRLRNEKMFEEKSGEPDYEKLLDDIFNKEE